MSLQLGFDDEGAATLHPDGTLEIALNDELVALNPKYTKLLQSFLNQYIETDKLDIYRDY